MASKTPAMILQELSIKNCGQAANYELITQNQGTHENLFEYVVDVLGITATGRGRSKKEAKQETAKNALLILNKHGKLDCVPPNLAQSSTQQLSPDDGELPSVVNYIGELGDVCLMNNLATPEYDLIFDDGPPHQKVFTYECRLGNSIVTKCSSSTKKQARQNTAKLMLDRLKGIVPELCKEHETIQLKLCDDDMQKDLFQELCQIRRSNLNIKIMDFYCYLRNLLQEKRFSFDDIKEYFEEPHTEEKLQELMKKLELTIRFVDLSEKDSNIYIIAAMAISVVPLCILGMGSTVENARLQALNNMFETCRIQLEHATILPGHIPGTSSSSELEQFLADAHRESIERH